MGKTKNQENYFRMDANFMIEIKNEKNLNLILYSFFNFSKLNEKQNYFVVGERFKKQNTYIDEKFLKEDQLQRHTEILAKYLDIENKEIKTKFKFDSANYYSSKIEISTNINNKICKTLDEIYQELYYLIFKYFSNSNIVKTELDKKILTNCFIPRGSYDNNRNYFSVDFIRRNASKKFYELAFNLLFSTNFAKQINFNYREGQPEYIISKRRRNTQVRLNATFIYKELYEETKKISFFKSYVLEKNSTTISKKEPIKHKSDLEIIDQVDLYINHILKKNINIDEIKYNKDIYLKQEFDEIETKEKRDSTIIIQAKLILEDICFGCYDKYSLADRTFKFRDKDLWYLEIHHVIAFSNGGVDVTDNLIKLCPACHRAMTKGRASKNLQLLIIANILKKSSMTDKFIQSISNLNEFEEKVNYIYSKLR